MATIIPTTRDAQSRARRAGYNPAALDATVVIVGVGAIGQNTAQNLALSGVRELRLIDPDRFEPHNLTRSPLFPPAARGSSDDLPKARLCAEALARLATNDEAVVLYADDWIEDLGAAALTDAAAVACCVDSLRARAYLAERCSQLGLPMIEAGFGGADVTVGSYPAAPDSACWRCGRVVHDEVTSCRAAAAAAERLSIVPAIQSAAAVAGGIQAEAVVTALHGRLPSARRLWLDIRTGAAAAADLPPDPGCHHREPAAIVATEVTVESPLRDVIAAAEEHLDGPIELELPSPFIAAAACARCSATLRVDAPGRRYARNPLCAACGGPWDAAPDEQPDNGVAYVTRDDPLVARSCASLGLAPGDVVDAGSASGEVAVRLRGTAGDVLTRA